MRFHRPAGRPAAIVAAWCAAVLACGALFAQTEEPAAPDEAKFDEQSLALRTALHYDPSIQAPLRSLITLYSKADRIDALVGIYSAHLTTYPDDASAQAVLIRVLREIRDPGAGQAVRAAAVRFPDEDYIRYLYYQELEASRDPAALDELSKALSMTSYPNRRRDWLDELVTKAAANGRVDLTKKHFEKLVAEQKDSPEALLQLSRKMHGASLHEMALKTLQEAAALSAAPETGVDIQLLAARAEAALGRFEDAGKRLDALLTKVAPDYWRRSQIVVQRVHLLKTDASREEMLKGARERFRTNPVSEAAALDLAEVLIASELRRDALEVMLKASILQPASERIERKALELLDRLGDEHTARAYLDKRLEAHPGRVDLRYRLVKALYLLADPKEAAENFAMLIGELKEDERLKQRLDLARFLRRMNQPADAVPILEAIVETNPERVDVLRELGEAYLAIGRRESARRLFANTLPKEAEIENFLDVVQFLMQQGMHLEAASFLKERLLGEDSNFELRLLLVEVLGKTGEQLEGEALVVSTRQLADTMARYNRWLEIASEFHDTFDAGEDFFDAEQGRLNVDASGWTADAIARFLSFCEIAGRHQQQAKIIAMLRDRVIDENIPAELRPRLRRLLVDALEKDPVNAFEVQEHLAVLMSEDDSRADEYKLRQARLHQSANRPDLALPLLRELEIGEIHDVALLTSSYQTFLDLNLTPEARRALERLTEIDSKTVGHWEKLLAMLAGIGDEDELRKAIRRLLAGLGKVQFTDESVRALQLHLIDSYWRSIAGVLARQDASEYDDIFNNLNAIEHQSAAGEDQLWVTWTRAFLLNRLGRQVARDEALETLGILASRFHRRIGESASASGTEGGIESGTEGGTEAAVPGVGVAAGVSEETRTGEPVHISFPDGLSVSLEHAIAMLKEPPGARGATPVVPTEGPGPDMKLRWTFESDPGTTIVQVESSGDNGLLLLDEQGNLYRIDVASGKLQWRKTRETVFGESYRPPNFSARQASNLTSRSFRLGTPLRSGYQAGGHAVSDAVEPTQLRVAPRFIVGGGGVVIVPAGTDLRCLRESDGAMLWASAVGGDVPPFHAGQAGSVPPDLSVFLDGDRIYTFEPRSGVACGVDLETGKLLWRRPVYGPQPSASAPPVLFALNSGASYSRGELFVYGVRSLVIDCATGEPTWAFDGDNVRSFPLTLSTQVDDPGGSFLAGGSNTPSPLSSALTGAYPGYGTPNSIWIDHLSSWQSRQLQLRSFLKYSGSLVAPATAWVHAQSKQAQPSRGVLSGSQLLLMAPQGISVLSMDLPLAAQMFPVSGTFLGFAGQKACVIKGNELAVINPAKGIAQRFPIADLEDGAEVEAVISGARIYLTSRDGIYCMNAHTGKTLFRSPWPDVLRGENSGDAGDPAAAAASTRAGNGAPMYYWNGVAGGVTGRTGYCIPPRNRVVGDTLFAVIEPGKIAALSSADK